jgi:hypothetical protein
MFKQFHHFAGAQGAEHPGQPVHSDLHFDVWVSLSPERPPLYYLISEDGQRIEFCSPQEAIEHGRTGGAHGTPIEPPALEDRAITRQPQAEDEPER